MQFLLNRIIKVKLNYQVHKINPKKMKYGGIKCTHITIQIVYKPNEIKLRKFQEFQL